jgi:hypothetical protein
MPLSPEVRAFIADGKVQCWHPYWPDDAIRRGVLTKRDGRDDLLDYTEAIPRERHANEAVARMNEIDYTAALPLAERVAAAFADKWAWSVDLLKTKADGWYVTDMATAAESWHWPTCPDVKRYLPIRGK